MQAAEATVAQTRAQLLEEQLSVRRLQGELSSAQECFTIEREELEGRVRLLTAAQQASKLRHTELSAKFEELSGQLTTAHEKLADHAAISAELAQRRAAERISKSKSGAPRTPTKGSPTKAVAARDPAVAADELPSEAGLRGAPLAVRLVSMRNQLKEERRRCAALEAQPVSYTHLTLPTKA